MRLDSEEQRANLLALIARAHRSPEEVPAVEALREAIRRAEVPAVKGGDE